jgi:hypothetical protein
VTAITSVCASNLKRLQSSRLEKGSPRPRPPTDVRIWRSNPAPSSSDSVFHRDVAQPGSALAWGARGREFKSRRPDQIFPFSERTKLGSGADPVHLWRRISRIIVVITTKGCGNEGRKSDTSEPFVRPHRVHRRRRQILAMVAIPHNAILHRFRDCLSALSQHRRSRLELGKIRQPNRCGWRSQRCSCTRDGLVNHRNRRGLQAYPHQPLINRDYNKRVAASSISPPGYLPKRGR